ncbi:MAG: L-rhamnose mutarotase [Rhizomicrobium sp.]
MDQIALLMRLKPGNETEYRKRHDEIWPELKKALIEAGIYDYSIFLDPQTLNLFAVLRLRPDNSRSELATQPIMRRWWDSMADLMYVDDTKKPIERPLTRVFHLD